MNFDVSKLLRRLEKMTIDNSPTILTAIGVTGTLTTAYLASKATIKAVDIVREEQRLLAERYHVDVRHELDSKDILDLTWKLYIPAASSAAFTIAAIVGANRVSTRRATALAAAYSISERAFSEYREKVVEKIGAKQERAYRDEIAQERVDRNPVDDNQVIITDGGNVLCYDHFSGRYFESSMEALRKAENDINYQILHDGYANVSDLYFLLGLSPTSVSEEVGWNQDRMLELVFSAVLSEDNRPCIAIDFDLHPNRKYAHFAGG